MQRLSTEEKKRLIYLVEQNPILYDTSHEDFFDVKKKDKIWDYIGQALGIHSKWKNYALSI